jgi:hypothetical protein
MPPSAALEEMKREAVLKSEFFQFANPVTAGTLEAKGQSYGEPITLGSLPIRQ